MAAYSLRHYGTSSSALTPRVIVLHFTETDTYPPVWSTFATDSPNRGELPGTCAHFVVDQQGVVHQLVPTDVRCRHTIGLNDSAVGIEVVQASHGNGSVWADQQILHRPAQLGALVALVRSLMARFGIAAGDVIGHATANSHRLFHDLQGWTNDHTDWQAADVAAFRSLL